MLAGGCCSGPGVEVFVPSLGRPGWGSDIEYELLDALGKATLLEMYLYALGRVERRDAIRSDASIVKSVEFKILEHGQYWLEERKGRSTHASIERESRFRGCAHFLSPTTQTTWT